MVPRLWGVSTIWLLWGAGAFAGVALACGSARRAGFSWRISLGGPLIWALTILTGSKVLALVERVVTPLPPAFRTWEDAGWLTGFRIPGGIIAFAAVLPLIGRLSSVDWRRFSDSAICGVPLALVFIRAGCFANGCCIGSVSDAPWAIAFPRGSRAFVWHLRLGRVAPEAAHALPVHPLQLYFGITAFLIMAALVWWRPYVRRPGALTLLFFVLYFPTTLFLESFREPVLPLNVTLSAGASIAALVFGMRVLWGGRHEAQPDHSLVGRTRRQERLTEGGSDEHND